MDAVGRHGCPCRVGMPSRFNRSAIARFPWRTTRHSQSARAIKAMLCGTGAAL